MPPSKNSDTRTLHPALENAFSRNGAPCFFCRQQRILEPRHKRGRRLGIESINGRDGKNTRRTASRSCSPGSGADTDAATSSDFATNSTTEKLHGDDNNIKKDPGLHNMGNVQKGTKSTPFGRGPDEKNSWRRGRPRARGLGFPVFGVSIKIKSDSIERRRRPKVSGAERLHRNKRLYKVRQS